MRKDDIRMNDVISCAQHSQSEIQHHHPPPEADPGHSEYLSYHSKYLCLIEARRPLIFILPGNEDMYDLAPEKLQEALMVKTTTVCSEGGGKMENINRMLENIRALSMKLHIQTW